MLTLDQISNSVVLVRVAFDLPSLRDTARIKDALATIKLLLSSNNKVVLATKWGRPKPNDIEYSTQKLLAVVEQELGLKAEFVNQFAGFEQAKASILDSANQVFLLENIYFKVDEKAKNLEKRAILAQNYSLLSDYFVDEAFPSSHRQEATNTEIKDILPWTFGLAYANEIKNLNRLKLAAQKPFVVVMAGAKLETKLPLLSKMLPKADKILLGGLLGFTFLQAAKELSYPNLPEIYDSYVEVEFLAQAIELLQNNPDKLVLPLDLIYEVIVGGPELAIGETTKAGKFGRDLGPKTLELFQKELQKAHTIFWNGTLGLYERPPFDRGTLELGKFIASQDSAFKVLGGGDTGSALPPEILEKFEFVSMGGGATLEYLSH